MSFGGGSSGGGAITAHTHSTAAGEGGNLRGENNTTTGTAIAFNSGTPVPIEVML